MVYDKVVNKTQNHGYIQIMVLTLFLIYFSQGALYPVGSIISQTSFILIILFCFYFLIRILVSNFQKKPFLKIWILFIFLNLIGILISGDISNAKQFGMVKGIMIATLPFFPFYYFAQKGIFDPKYLRLFLIILIPISILGYYFRETQILSNKVDEDADIVNNAAYTFVALVPYLFLLKSKKLLANILLVILMFFVIQSAKRGALITGVLGLVIFLYYQFKTINKKQRLRGLLLISIGMVVMFYFLKQFYESNEYLITRLQSLEEGDSSGRDIIYGKIWNGWLEGNSLQLLFGFGFASSIQFAGNYAHNDWLELISNFGMTGVILYLLLFYYGFKTVFARKTPPVKRLLLFCVMVQWLFITLVSMGYTSNSDSYLRAILLGGIFGSDSDEFE